MTRAPASQELAAEFAARGARVLIAGAEAAGATSLPAIAAHPVIEPLLTIQSFLPHGERSWRWRAASIPIGRRISTK